MDNSNLTYRMVELTFKYLSLRIISFEYILCIYNSIHKMNILFSLTNIIRDRVFIHQLDDLTLKSIASRDVIWLTLLQT